MVAPEAVPEAGPDRERFRIAPVRSADELEVVRQLFTAYAAGLDVDLVYQDFEHELAALPGKYGPPAGELLLARGGAGEPIGCVGLRPMAAPACCEMKRLYVAPPARGLKLGRALVDAVIVEAKRIGYREMRLDTLPSMAEAIGLYRRAGFAPIEPYSATPVAGTIFLGRRLDG